MSSDLTTSHYFIVYSAYMNKAIPDIDGIAIPTRRKKHGRRLAMKDCIIMPTAEEMAIASEQLGFNAIAEPDKIYPRGYMQVGRIRVELADKNGNFIHPEIRSTTQLMRAIKPLIKVQRDEIAIQKADERRARAIKREKKRQKKRRR
ncbi:hypothetical protein PCE1_002857 [Barthelona sp. PCE]